MSDTLSISQRLSQAMEDTLSGHLADYSPGPTHPSRITYHHSSQDMTPQKCPAIVILDRGSFTLEESARGRNADGSLAPGYVLREYNFLLGIYLVGKGKDALISETNLYRDAISACLEQYYSLGDYAIEVRVRADDPVVDFDFGSAILTLGTVQAALTAWHLQGHTVLVDNS